MKKKLFILLSFLLTIISAGCGNDHEIDTNLSEPYYPIQEGKIYAEMYKKV